MKQALGLAISGTEVRLAYLVSDKGQLRIAGLDTTSLTDVLEPNAPEKSKPASAEPDSSGKDVFGLKEPAAEKETAEAPAKRNNSSLEILYKLLYQYTRKRIKIGFNLPVAMVNYQRQDIPVSKAPASLRERLGFGEKDGDLSLNHEAIRSRDGTALGLSFEQNPPTLSLLRDVKDYLGGNLYLASMESTEVALANLARTRLDPHSGKMSAIIYIEDELTRLIFLRGADIIHVSAAIYENVTSPRILEVIYRKLLYEQDEAQIPELAHIFLAGRGFRINAQPFFAECFIEAEVAYLASDLMSYTASEQLNDEILSEYALAIALAWKVIEPKNSAFIPLNLIPPDLRDQQDVLKLAWHGYILLAITGLTAFFVTWQIFSVRSELSSMRAKSRQMEMQIGASTQKVDRVLDLEEQSKNLSASISLTDSLSKSHDELLLFLQKLNGGVARIGGIWLNEIRKHETGYTIKGSSLNRQKIPLLAESLNGASLTEVTRGNSESQKLVHFSLECPRAVLEQKLTDEKQGIRVIDPDNFSFSRNLTLTQQTTQGQASQGQASQGQASQGQASRPTAKSSEGNQTPVVDVNQLLSHKTDGKSGTSKATAANQPATQRSGAQDREVSNAGSSHNPEAASVTTASQSASQKSGMQDGAASKTNSNNANAKPKAGGLASVEASSPGSHLNGSPEKKSPSLTNTSPFFTIEIAATQSRPLAEQYAISYRKKGFEAEISQNDQSDPSKRFQVIVGKFAGRTEAEKEKGRLVASIPGNYRIVEIGARGSMISVPAATVTKQTALANPVPSSPIDGASSPAERNKQSGAAMAQRDGSTQRPETTKAPAQSSPQVAIPPASSAGNDFSKAGHSAASHSGAGQSSQGPESGAKDGAKPGSEQEPKVTPEIYLGYSIEAGNSYTRELVEQYAKIYRDRGYSAAVERYFDQGRGAYWYRVLIGVFDSKPAAEKFASEMGSVLVGGYRIVGIK